MERRKNKKNENGRRETERMRSAVEIIGKHYGMKKATRSQILAVLVDKSKLSASPEYCARSES